MDNASLFRRSADKTCAISYNVRSTISLYEMFFRNFEIYFYLNYSILQKHFFKDIFIIPEDIIWIIEDVKKRASFLIESLITLKRL